MPNLDDWREYEKKKDKFMEELYIRIQKREEKRDDKEKKELGIPNKSVEQPKKPLTPKEMQVYQLRNTYNKTYAQIGKEMGFHQTRACAIYKNVLKKLNFVGIPNNLDVLNNSQADNKINLECSDD